MGLFKAFIRVVKSIGVGQDAYFGLGIDNEIVRIPVIEAADKKSVKEYLLSEYPQFFQNGNVYEKETKDQAQFFYVVIYPLYQWEIDMINEGEWTCASCGQVHENKYVSRPRRSKLFGDNILFCRSGDDDELCLDNFKKEKYKYVEFPDDEAFVKKESLNYIYRCTEKSTGKSYVGKTRNEPFFRWWSHLKHSGSPFGMYLRQTKLSDWTFEVLEILPADIDDKEVFRIESEYIVKYDSINNGFNSVISNRNVVQDNDIEVPQLFENIAIVKPKT